MMIAALPCFGYAGIRYSEIMRLDEYIAQDLKTLRDEDADSTKATMARASLHENEGFRIDKMSEITTFGPLGAGLLVVGLLLAVAGGRKKK